jgi:hypothetical protein
LNVIESPEYEWANPAAADAALVFMFRGPWLESHG